MASVDPLLEQTAQRPRRPRRLPRVPSRLEAWAWSEIPAYRLGLFLGYVVLVYIGVSALIAGVPIFDLTAPEGYVVFWGPALALSGIAGAAGSIRDTPRYRAIELPGAWIASVLLVGYAGPLLTVAYGTGDPNRAAIGAVLVGLTIPPVIRMLWLQAKVISDRKAKRRAKLHPMPGPLVVLV